MDTTRTGALVLLACMPAIALTLRWALRRRRGHTPRPRLALAALACSAALLVAGIALSASAVASSLP